MADQDNTTDTTDTTFSGETLAGEPAPPADEAPTAAESELTEPAAEEPAAETPAPDPALADEPPVEEPASADEPATVLTADEETLAAAAIPVRAAVTESEAPRYGAQFSSPEPTTVTARPRRRATRPALSADPDSVEPAPPAAPTLPAFITFVAPSETVAEAPAAPRRRSRRTVAETPAEAPAESVETSTESPAEDQPAAQADEGRPAPRRSRSRRRAVDPEPAATETDVEDDTVGVPADADEDDRTGNDRSADGETEDGDDDGSGASRRRRRGRRGRGRGRTGEDADDSPEDNEDAGTAGADQADDEAPEGAQDGAEDDADGAESESGSGTRRRRRRRRRGESAGTAAAEEPVEDAEERPERAGRGGRTSEDDVVRGIAGSTRLEAKRQRRRDGRDTGRKRAPILSESEFLARREAVDRAMVIRQQGDRTQIAVLEDDILVEHYVTQAQATSFAGNVYLGRVQNVLPSMEAAFVDIGKGRNAVVYAGEVNWDAAGLSGKARSIEQAFKSGDKILCQVTKDPIGHKGARLTQQINLPGRFLVYVPGGSMTGISRKLPDNERQRLKDILKKIVPEDAGVIIRTAAEGASEEELTRDVARLQAQWEVIQKKAETSSAAPALLYGEPDLAIRVIRDVFNEDFKRLVVQGADAWDTVEGYVGHVSPELSPRLSRYVGTGDVFGDLRVDEQLLKALDRKVYLPSGGSLVIDRTEAMTVVDVNTGKFVGSGGNLEQTVTRNNIEAAEEIVRQLRLRDIGGIIVIDFIDMVLESNRDLVLRRLTECLGRDRTKHQVAEVTSLGLVQMTRKRVGQGLLEVFSEPCEHCRGRGVLVHLDPAEAGRRSGNGSSGSGGSGSGGSGNGSSNNGGSGSHGIPTPGGRQRQDRSGGREATAPAPVDVVEASVPVGVEEQPADDAGETPRTGGGRRNRGRRGRGQSGEARAAEDAAVLADSADEPAEDDSTDQLLVEEVADAEGEPTHEQLADVELVDSAPVEDGDAPESAPESEMVQVLVAETGPDAVELAVAEPRVERVTDAYLTEIRIGGPQPDTEPQSSVHLLDVQEVGSPEVPAEPEPAEESAAAPARPRRRRAASRPAGPPVG